MVISNTKDIFCKENDTELRSRINLKRSIFQPQARGLVKNVLTNNTPYSCSPQRDDESPVSLLQ